MEEVPSVTGKQLIKLLIADGWELDRRTTHGLILKKNVSDHTKITVVPDKRAALPEGTLGAILGPKQTALGKDGLRRLLAEHGKRLKGRRSRR